MDEALTLFDLKWLYMYLETHEVFEHLRSLNMRSDSFSDRDRDSRGLSILSGLVPLFEKTRRSSWSLLTFDRWHKCPGNSSGLSRPLRHITNRGIMSDNSLHLVFTFLARDRYAYIHASADVSVGACSFILTANRP